MGASQLAVQEADGNLTYWQWLHRTSKVTAMKACAQTIIIEVENKDGVGLAQVFATIRNNGAVTQ